MNVSRMQRIYFTDKAFTKVLIFFLNWSITPSDHWHHSVMTSDTISAKIIMNSYAFSTIQKNR